MVRNQAVAILVSLAVSACGGGFEAIKPEGTEIVFIRNSALGLNEFDATQYQPLPLPIREHGPSDKKQLPIITPPEEANIAVFPYQTSAKMFYEMGATRFTCSAQFVGSTDVALTAAHCVYSADQRRWGKGFAFLRGYRDGAWVEAHDWGCMPIFSGWTAGQYSRDYAFVKLRSAASRALGLSDALPAEVEAIGYPSNYFNGLRLMRTVGVAERDSGVHRMGSAFGAGSSGGAWLNGPRAISVNSFGYDNQPNIMHGPAFDADTTRLYEFVRNDCSASVPPTVMRDLISKAPDETAVIGVNDGNWEISPHIEERSQGSEQSLYLLNPLDDPFWVSIRFSANPLSAMAGASDVRIMRIPAQSELYLGCKPDASNTNTCSQPIVPMITRVARARDNESQLHSLDFVASVDSEFCAKRCIESPNDGWCIKLGQESSVIISPLAAFIDADLRRPPEDGKVATMNDLISRFGGRAGLIEDPCARGDFLSEEGEIRNYGLGCRATTRKLEDLGAIRLSSVTPSTLRSR